MTLRTRILLAASLLVLLPTLVLSLAGRQQTAHRLREQHAARLDAMATLLEEDLALRADAIAARLAALGRDLQGDLALRRALTGDDPASQRLRIDLAARRMALMGLDVLQIQDAEGRILSAGHFRDAFDRREPGLADALARQPGGTALAEFRRPEGSLLALTRLDSLRLDGRDYRLLGGERLDDAALRRLAGGSGLRLALLVDGEPRATSGGPLPGEADRSLPLAALGPRGEPREGVLLLAESRGALAALLGGFDLWLLGALTATLAGGLALALWLSTRLGRPLRDLAARTERLDLDNLDADFPLPVSAATRWARWRGRCRCSRRACAADAWPWSRPSAAPPWAISRGRSRTTSATASRRCATCWRISRAWRGRRRPSCRPSTWSGRAR